MHDSKILEKIRSSRKRHETKIGFRTFHTRKLCASDAVIVKSWVATMIGDKAFAKLLELGAKAAAEGGADLVASIFTMPEIVTQVAAAFGKVLRDRETAIAFFETLFARTFCDYAIDASGQIADGPICLADVWEDTLQDAPGELERAAWWVLSVNFDLASLAAGLSSEKTDAGQARGAEDSSEPAP